jgi:secreted trypsin-like serine protease
LTLARADCYLRTRAELRVGECKMLRYGILIGLLMLIGCDAGGAAEVAVAREAINGGNIVGAAAKPLYLVRMKRADGFHYCGGTLLTQSWFLTAAHCVNESNYPTATATVIAGDRTLSVNEGTEQSRSIAFVIVHPDYVFSPPNHYNDLALVRVSAPFTFNSYVGAVGNLASSTPTVGQWGVVYGWGNTAYGVGPSDALRSASVQVLSRSACQALWDAEPHVDGVVIDTKQFCAFLDAPFTYTSIDKGDSGGPLVSSGLSGVSSMAFTYSQNMPGIFADVSQYTGWINEIVFDSVWLEPIADTYVRAGTYANTNYGDATLGGVKNDSSANFDRELYMIFDLDGVASEILDATLWQSCRRSSSATPVPEVRLRQLYSTGETWDEDTLTWNNRYVDGRTMATKTISSLSWDYYAWRSAELTYRLETQRGGLIAFREYAINAPSTANVECAMREHSSLAQLPLLQLVLQ